VFTFMHCSDLAQEVPELVDTGSWHDLNRKAFAKQISLQDCFCSTISEHSPHANILSQDVVDLICPHSCVIEGHEYVKLEKLHNFVSNFSLFNAVSYFSDRPFGYESPSMILGEERTLPRSEYRKQVSSERCSMAISEQKVNTSRRQFHSPLACRTAIATRNSVEQRLTSFSGTAVQCKFLISASPDFCHLRCRVHKLSLICASRIISIVTVQVPKSRRTPPRFAPIGEQQSYANAGVADATAVIRDWLGYTMRSYAATAITNAGRFCNK